MKPGITIGIIGYGDFGKLTYTLAKKHVPRVDIKVFTRSHKTDNKLFFSLKEVCQSDVLFLSVPISAFKATLEQIIPYIKKDTVIVDVAAAKVYPAKILKEHSEELSYITTHPLFGPFGYEKRKHSLSGLRVVVSEHNLSQDIYSSILSFLKNLGLVVIEMSPDEHDKFIAETLFLTHLIGQVVHQGGFERTSIDTPSFGFVMDAVESVRHDTPLFKDVFTHNPHCADVLRRFKEALKKTESLLK